VSAVVEIQNLDRVIDALSRISDAGAVQVMRRITFAIGEEVRNVIAVYPPKPRYPLRWASQKQRFYVLRVLQKNAGPYLRGAGFEGGAKTSQQLGQSWATVNSGTGAIVGTRATYAPYVQSAQQQQPFHADTGWVTDEQAVKRVSESGVIDDIFRDVLHAALR